MAGEPHQRSAVTRHLYARNERAGLAVVLAIFVSACVVLYETILRFIYPQHLTHL